jgi:hypothetical protein
MRRGEFIFPALILAVTVVLLLLGAFYYQYGRVVFMFPLAAGIALCALCLNEMVAVVQGRARTAPPLTDEPETPMSLPGLGWMLALLLFLYGLGFVFGSAAYLLLCLRANGFSWKVAGGIAAAALIATWGLFIKVLAIQLPIEPLWMG